MRITVLAFLILISTSLFAQNDTLGLEWSNDYFLQWSDFQGHEDKDLTLSALSRIAIPYTYTSDGEVDLTVNLATVFVKSESWYKKGKENHILLAHEQLHFDIAEIHRRMIVKAILNATFSRESYDSELRKIITDLWDNEYRDMQDKYDAETNYARFFRSQIDWNKSVAEKLLELDEYKAKEITVTFR